MQNHILTTVSIAPVGLLGLSGSVLPSRPRPTKLEGPAGRLRHRVAVASRPSSTRLRASLEPLHERAHKTLSGLARDAKTTLLDAAKQALFNAPVTVAPAMVARPFLNHHTHQQLSPTAAVDLSTVAFEEHAPEPVGEAQLMHAEQDHSVAPMNVWMRTAQNAGIEGQSDKGPCLCASGFGSVGVGGLNRTLAVSQNQLGQATLRGRAELCATASSLGKVSADQTGVAVRAGVHAKAALTTSSSAMWSVPPPVSIEVVGIQVDMTPGATVNGRTSLGLEGGGSVFAGISVPTHEERAAGMAFKAGLEANSSIFLGAKADGDASIGIGGNKIGMTGGVWVGAGAEGKVRGSLSQTPGQTTAHLEMRAGAALGAGLMLGFMAEVNVQPAVDVAQTILTTWAGAVKD